MIVKTLVRKRANSYKQLFAYIMKPHAGLPKKELKKVVFKHNVYGSTHEEWVEQFRLNETFRKYKRKDSNMIVHEMISWHKSDSEKITNEFLRSFMEFYSSVRCDSPMYVATVHREKDHVHLHVAMSGLNFRSGYSVSLKRKRYLEMIKSLQSYHLRQYPEITHSTVDFDAQKKERRKSNREYMFSHRTGTVSRKEKLTMKLEACYRQAASLQEFLTLLQSHGIEVYYRREKVTGVRDRTGRKYRFRTLGFTDERLQALDRQMHHSIDGQLEKGSQRSRLNLLKEMRGRSKKELEMKR